MKRKNYFTLFELLISIGLLVVLTIVLLRMFLLTSDLWGASDEQSRLYADAQTALSVISDDLNNIIYQNQSVNTPAGTSDVTAPLWLEKKDWNDYGLINAYSVRTGHAYTPALHLVTRPTMKTVSHSGSNFTESTNISGIYLVSYHFLPPLSQNNVSSTWPKYLQCADGVLARACIADVDNLLNRTATTNMSSVFTAADSDYRVVITGVLEFKILAYQLETDSFGNETWTLVDLSSGNSTGAEDIGMIQIVLTLIAPERLDQLRKMSDSDDVKEYLAQHSRTFCKTIRIRNGIEE